LPAAIVEVADAVKDAIEAHDFGVSFLCERSWADWSLELEDADCLRVDVVPVGYSEADIGASDNRVAYACQVDVAIRKRFGMSEQSALNGRIEDAQLDRLALLTEQIFEHLTKRAQRRLSSEITYSDARVLWQGNKRHLKEWRQYSGLIRMTYDVHRET
jgi:hypothetical protein